MQSSHLTLIGKLAAYYFFIIAALVVLALFRPALMDYLPFGGLDEMVADSAGFSSLQEEIEATYHPINDFHSSIQLLMALTGTIIVMLPIRWVYTEIRFGSYNQSIAANVILLPLIVTGIVYIVQNSLALAFSLAGIVAGVSYRTRLKDSSDALYIFVSIAIGLAAGTQSLGIALVMSVFFVFSVIALPPREIQRDTVHETGETGEKPAENPEQQ